jgi:cytochrome oxidase Cu insertion factor (SCO1/SenC/PrrC family)
MGDLNRLNDGSAEHHAQTPDAVSRREFLGKTAAAVAGWTICPGVCSAALALCPQATG